MKIYRYLIPVVVLLTFSLTAQAAWLPLASQQKQTKSERSVRIFALKHAAIDETIELLQELHDFEDEGFRMTADHRTNSIITLCLEKDFRVIEQILNKIDVPVSRGKSPGPSEVLKIFPVDSRLLNASFLQILERVYGGRIAFSVDEERSMIIANADRKSIDEMDLFLQNYEDQFRHSNAQIALKKKEENSATNIRLYWLVSGDEENDLPKELRPIALELEKLNIENLRVATLMNIVANDHFEISGSSQIEENITLEFEGELGSESSQERRMAEIQIHAEKSTPVEGGKNRTISLGHLRTSVNAPLGHFVVLGTSSIQKRNSVFVLQFLPAN